MLQYQFSEYQTDVNGERTERLAMQLKMAGFQVSILAITSSSGLATTLERLVSPIVVRPNFYSIPYFYQLIDRTVSNITSYWICQGC